MAGGGKQFSTFGLILRCTGTRRFFPGLVLIITITSSLKNKLVPTGRTYLLEKDVGGVFHRDRLFEICLWYNRTLLVDNASLSL